MAASVMTDVRLAALEAAVAQAAGGWREAADLLEEGGGKLTAVDLRVRAVQAESALEVVKARFGR